MPYQKYISRQQQQFYQPLPPGKSDLDILKNLKMIIKEGQQEFYHAVLQPAALASLCMGHIPQGIPHPDQLQDYHSPDMNNVPFRPLMPFSHSPFSQTVEPDTLANNLGAETVDSNQPDPEDTAQGPPVEEAMGEYGTRPPVDTAPTKDDEPAQLTGENAWECPTPDDTKFDGNPPPNRASTYDNRPPNGTPATDVCLPPSEDCRVHDRDWDRTDLDRDRVFDRHLCDMDCRERRLEEMWAKAQSASWPQSMRT